MLALSTASIAALLAYIGTVGGGVKNTWNILALVFLFIASVTSILNINSLINKVYSGDDEAIKNKEVKILNWILSLALLLGLCFSAFYILSCKPSDKKNMVGSNRLYVDSDCVSVPSNFTGSVTIEKEGGDIKRVIVNEGSKTKASQDTD
jgi:hypothetical protein